MELVIAICTAVAVAAIAIAVCWRVLAGQERKFAAFMASQREASDRGMEALRHEFAALAATTLNGSARELSVENAARVQPLFDRMKEDFAALRAAAEAARRENAVLGASLKERIAEVGAASQGLGRQAEEFIAALRGGSKVQGDWGEGILTQVLEDAGLREGVNFAVQRGTKESGLPDVTVFDGAKRRILIDSKVNVSGFIAATNAAKAGDSEGAARLMREHAKAVRAQIQGLADRRYPERMKESCPDLEFSPVVIMFMPSEATYAAAVSADPAIVSFANSHGVVIATPQMLFGYLVLFKLGLDRLQADRRNGEILQRVNQILDRMDAAFAAFDEVGKALDKATVKYHESLRKLGFEQGGVNIITPARELSRLINASKKRDSAMLR